MAGGVESYSWAVSQAFTRICTQVALLTASTSGKLPTEETQLRRVTCLRGRSQFLLLFRFVMQLLLRRIKGEKFDVIHATTWRMALPALLVFPTSKLVITIHGNEILVKSALLKRLMRWVMSRAELLVCVSGYTETLLREVISPLNVRILINYNGISNSASGTHVEAKWTESNDPLKVFTVCRHEPRKNLVAALEGFISSGIEGEYRIAGTGPETEKLKAIIEKYPNAKVRLLGRISDSQLKEEFSNASIFLHPQIEIKSSGDVEGFGLVVADAMAHGCVVIAGANGGTKELIDHHATGLALNICDSDEIDTQLTWCDRNQAQLGRIGLAAHKRASAHFDWDKHADKILSELK